MQQIFLKVPEKKGCFLDGCHVCEHLLVFLFINLVLMWKSHECKPVLCSCFNLLAQKFFLFSIEVCDSYRDSGFPMAPTLCALKMTFPYLEKELIV